MRRREHGREEMLRRGRREAVLRAEGSCPEGQHLHPLHEALGARGALRGCMISWLWSTRRPDPADQGWPVAQQRQWSARWSEMARATVGQGV